VVATVGPMPSRQAECRKPGNKGVKLLMTALPCMREGAQACTPPPPAQVESGGSKRGQRTSGKARGGHLYVLLDYLLTFHPQGFWAVAVH
jgi:hypothetical protein